MNNLMLHSLMGNSATGEGLSLLGTKVGQSLRFRSGSMGQLVRSSGRPGGVAPHDARPRHGFPRFPSSKPEGEEEVLGYSHNMLLGNELDFPLNGTHCLLAPRISFNCGRVFSGSKELGLYFNLL